MANGKRRGTGTMNEVTDTSPTKEQKTISTSELTEENMEELADKEFFHRYKAP